MPISGQNAGTSDLNLKEAVIVAQGTNNTVSGSAPAINLTGGFLQRYGFTAAPRCSVEVDEVGVTLMQTLAADTEIKFYQNTTEIAKITITSGAVAGTEFTTRDGSISWESGYETRAGRVFSKGTSIQVGFGGSSDTNKSFAVYAITKEAGAGPA